MQLDSHHVLMLNRVLKDRKMMEFIVVRYKWFDTNRLNEFILTVLRRDSYGSYNKDDLNEIREAYLTFNKHTKGKNK